MLQCSYSCLGMFLNKFYHPIIAILFLLFTSFSTVLKGQDYENLIFDKIKLDDGLIGNQITKITQDQVGRIWISTSVGISIYDGESIRNLDHRQLGNGFLYIWDLLDDNKGNMLISNGKGIVTYNYKSEALNFYPINLEKNATSQTQCMFMDSGGDIWVGLNNGLVKLEYNADTLIYEDYLGIGQQQQYYVSDIAEDRYGNLWICNDDVLLVKLANTNRFERVNFSLSGKIKGVFSNQEGELLMYGTFGVYSIDGQVSFSVKNFRETINHDFDTLVDVSALTQDLEGSYWMVIKGSRILILQKKKGGLYKSFIHMSDVKNPHSLSTNFIKTIFVDREGVVWLGSFRYGVDKCYVKSGKFKIIEPNTDKFEEGLDRRYVFCSFVDDNKDLWFYAKGGPIHIHDFLKDTTIHLPEHLLPESSWSFTSMVKKENRIYATTQWTGVGLYEVTLPENFKVNRESQDYVKKNYFVNEGERSIGNQVYLDSKNQLWYLSGAGIFLMNNGIFQEVFDADGQSFGNVKKIFEDKKSNYWLAVDNGFVKMNLNDRTIIRYDEVMPDFADGGSINFFTEVDGDLWIGHNVFGLFQFDPKQEKIAKKIRADEGLPNENVRAMIKDAHGYLWIATGGGLIRYNPDNRKIKAFDKDDGLPSLEFTSSEIETYNNNLIFGTSMGICVVNPDEFLNKSDFRPKTYFTHLYVNDELQKIDKEDKSILHESLIFQPEITLDYFQNDFKIEFKCDSYANPKDIKYAYMLEGFDVSWKYTNAKSSYAKYNNLPAGTYSLLSKSSNVDGEWSENVSTLRINVLPSWWTTWWFRVSVVVLLAIVFIKVYLININSLKNQRKLLEEKVTERTVKLKEANHALESSHHEIKGQKDVLQSAFEKLKNAQSQMLQSEKMASIGVLTAGIAHEINNPLNFIVGNKMLLTNYIEENLQDHHDELFPMLSRLQTGLDRTTSIVKSLSRFNRHNSSYSELCDIHLVVSNCLTILNSQFKNRIEVTLYLAKESYKLYGNEGELHQLIMNVLSNAEQAISDEGKVIVKSEVLEDWFHLTIIDSGGGIDPKDIDQITNPFFTTKEPGKGTGLGLSISYDIVRRHHGRLTFDSKVGEGTSVLIELPLIFVK